MPPYVFIERSRSGRVIYTINGETLSVYGKRGASRFSQEISLWHIAVPPEGFRLRYYRTVIVNLGIAAITGAMTLLIVFQRLIPDAAAHYYAHPFGIFFAVSFGTALTWIPEVRVLRFKDRFGVPLFEMVHTRRNSRDLVEFLRRLESSIAKSKKPNQSLEPTTVLVMPRAGARVTPSTVVAHL